MLMWTLIPNVKDAIVKKTLEKYKQLPKQGKPIIHETKAEWTVLASIVMIHCRTYNIYVYI
jgi:tRNA-specific adenosine deaminase 1